MAGVSIQINAGNEMKESRVSATGGNRHIITDSERGTFNIGSDSQLKSAVGRYFGKVPSDAFLHSPTPWGDLYKRYGWPEVQTVLQVKSAVIRGIEAKPVILAKKTLRNDSNKRAKFSAKISEQVTNSVATTWSNSNKISVGQTIEYKFTFFGGSSSFGYERTWGKSETVTKQTTVGTETGVSVTLEPHQSAEVILTASSGKMQVRITYEAYLIGDSAVNYNPTYKGHHFWALNIGEVIGRSSNRVEIVEDMEIGYFSNSDVIIKSNDSANSLEYHLAKHPDEPPTEEDEEV